MTTETSPFFRADCANCGWSTTCVDDGEAYICADADMCHQNQQINALNKAVHRLSVQLGRIHEAAEQHRIARRSARTWETLYRECTKRVEL